MFCLWQIPVHAYTIKGKIELKKDWERKIYLSLIPSFDDLSTASSELIVNVADIAHDGTFILSGQNLPTDDRIYRLHVCKNGDPPATLFIGGQEENHFHLILNNASDIVFQSDGLFQNAEALGHPSNALLSGLDEELNNLRKTPKVNTQINRENRSQRLYDFLVQYVDTCSHAIPAILAADQLDLERLMVERPKFFDEKMNSWSNDSDLPYFSDLQKKVDIIRHKSRRTSKSWLMEGLLVCGLILLFYLFRKKISEREEAFRPEADLSVQERRVLRLLSGGKSNKEISEELHIEVSTVKSHVSKIYSKLGVRSRKDVVGKYT